MCVLPAGALKRYINKYIVAVALKLKGEHLPAGSLRAISTRCFTAALLLLYCCFTAALLQLYCSFTAALLPLYCCFTAALYIEQLPAGRAPIDALPCCSSKAAAVKLQVKLQ
jgi:hypothetical protein